MDELDLWTGWIFRVCLFATGVVHLLPAVGVLGPERLRRLYGVEADDAVVLLLLRHRALLFGLIGIALCASATSGSHSILAAGLGLASMIGFIVLARGHDAIAPIRRIIRIDAVLSVVLALALFLKLS